MYEMITMHYRRRTSPAASAILLAYRLMGLSHQIGVEYTTEDQDTSWHVAGRHSLTPVGALLGLTGQVPYTAVSIGSSIRSGKDMDSGKAESVGLQVKNAPE